MGDYFVDELQLVGLNLFADIDSIFGDNCATNKKLAVEISRKIVENHGHAQAWKVPLVGCNSHRLNIARQDFYAAVGRIEFIKSGRSDGKLANFKEF